VPDQNILGIPGSKGCINMSNNDVKDIFDAVVVGTPVHIE
jgi:lipoprotein-anchoring transpeptidase ErfK/SrfK